MELLKQLCAIQATAGDESAMTEFILNWIEANKHTFKVMPQVYCGDEFHDSVILVFGKPRAAVFAHIDSVGFTVRYKNSLVKIGSPRSESGYSLTGRDSKGHIDCYLQLDKERNLSCKFERDIDPGTTLTFQPDFRETNDFVQSPYLDNRLGVMNAMNLAKSLEHGAIVFSCREEHAGGSTAFAGKFLYEKYQISKALISDITWITEGVTHGNGVVISLRDSGIPRKKYLDQILSIAKESTIKFQIEVEGAGGSDGNELQRSCYPWDWCFIGAAEDFVHSPDEKVSKQDVYYMFEMYKYLMDRI